MGMFKRVIGAILAVLLFAAPAFAEEEKEAAANQRVASHESESLSASSDDASADPGFLGSAGSAEKEAKIHGHEEGLVGRPGITGNWGGLRDTLEGYGIEIKGVYTGELVHNFSGGAFNRTGGIYHDNLDLTLTLDTGKAGLWNGGKLFLYGLRNHGSDPSAAMIGDLQTASNIEAPDQFILHEAWYNHDFADGVVSLLAGFHNLNSEFCVTNYGSLFLNSSFGIEPEISGNVPLSIFPQAGLGARLRVRPVESVYLQAAVYDGDPSTREIYPSEGNFAITEAGLEIDGSDYKVGYWRHSAEKVYGTETFDGDYGMYGIIDQKLIEFDNEEHSAIGVFMQYGWVPSERNDVTGYIGGGIHMHGLIPSREVDDLGFAVAHAKTHLDPETAYELTYRLVVTPWISVRPSYQWIQNPGGDATVPMAQAGFLRFEVQL